MARKSRFSSKVQQKSLENSHSRCNFSHLPRREIIAIKNDFVVNLYSAPHKGQIRLRINRDFWFCKNENVADYFAALGAQEIWQDVEQTYNVVLSKYANFACYSGKDLTSGSYSSPGWLYLSWNFYVTLPMVDEFLKPAYVQAMTEVILAMYDAHVKILPYREAE